MRLEPRFDRIETRKPRCSVPTMLCVALCVVLCLPSSLARGQTEPTSERDLVDILGPLVVEATPASEFGRKLMSIAVEPSLDASEHDVLLHSIIARDLELSGEFKVLSGERLPVGAYTSEDLPDLRAWRTTGIEALIRLRARGIRDVRLMAEVYLTSTENGPAFRRVVRISAPETRLASHRLADSLIGALTGHPGGFSSRLTFTLTAGASRAVYVVDADGNELRRAAPQHDLVSASAFGPDNEVYFAASVRHGAYRLYAESRSAPIHVLPSGSIYGVAFNHERTEIALALAVGTTVSVFRGSLSSRIPLVVASRTDMALSPAFSPTGRLAYVGIDPHGNSRIYVGERPASPPRLSASAPVFCNHATGTRLIYAVGVGKRTDLVVANDLGRGAMRLTEGPGSNGYPACSPDGRLVAFFSTRSSGEGPGLYVMPLMGGRPKRISSALGTALQWATITE